MNKKSGILWLSWLDTKLHADLLFFFFLKLELTRNSVCYYTSGFIYFYVIICLLVYLRHRVSLWSLGWPRLADFSLPLLGLMVSHHHAPLGACTLNPGTMLNFFLALISWCSGCLVGARTAPLDLLDPAFPVHPLLPFICSFVLKEDAVWWVPDPPATTQVPGLGDYTVHPQGLWDSALS